MLENALKFAIIAAIAIGVLTLLFQLNQGHSAVKNDGSVDRSMVANQQMSSVEELNEVPTSNPSEMNQNNVHYSTSMPPVDTNAFADTRDGNGYGPLPSTDSGSPVLGQTVPASMSMDKEAEQLRKASCFPKNQLTPAELLPTDNESAGWAALYPEGQGTLQNRNFLQAGFNTGIDTVGQTLRNANLQLRSEPPNPQVAVSPWLQSTIEPDVNRKPFEIGGC